MISIIICSVNPDDLIRVKKEISTTIGTEYELLVWDNRETNKGLCEVYNMMGAKAQFEYILFLHEDILFNTNNWGIKLISTFSERPEVGAIGVAGSKYKSDSFSGWYTGIKEFDCVNIIHRYSQGDDIQQLRPTSDGFSQEVICLDGVFICCRKAIFETTKFDEDNLRGFHFYDIDFTLRVAKKSTILVTYDIEIVHVTKGGDFGERWVKIAIDYHLLHKSEFPYTKLTQIPAAVKTHISKNWLDVLKNYDISLRNKMKWVIYQKLYFHSSLYYSILKFILYKPLGLKHFHKSAKSK